MLPESCPRLRSVHFVDPEDGFGVAGGDLLRDDSGVALPVRGGELVLTTDGGKRWRRVLSAPANVTDACFTNTTDGWAATPEHVWKTVDGGRHWSASFTEPPHIQPDIGGALGRPGDTPEVQCAQPDSAWAQFLGYDSGMSKTSFVAFATQDGVHWHAVLEGPNELPDMPSVHTAPSPGSYPGPFSLVNSTTAAFAGQDPAVGYGAAPLAIVQDGGTSVSERGPVAGITAADGMAFVTAGKGWVVGTNMTGSDRYDSLIEATANGGRTWTQQYKMWASTSLATR